MPISKLSTLPIVLKILKTIEHVIQITLEHVYIHNNTFRKQTKKHFSRRSFFDSDMLTKSAHLLCTRPDLIFQNLSQIKIFLKLIRIFFMKPASISKFYLHNRQVLMTPNTTTSMKQSFIERCCK